LRQEKRAAEKEYVQKIEEQGSIQGYFSKKANR